MSAAMNRTVLGGTESLGEIKTKMIHNIGVGNRLDSLGPNLLIAIANRVRSVTIIRMSSAREERIRSMAAALKGISDSQLESTEAVIAQFHIKPDVKRNLESNLVTACVAEEFADALQIHHCLSTEALSKDKFEYALERIMNRCDIPAKLANKGNPGHDMTLPGVPYSLKAFLVIDGVRH